ncbi:hypothetical protein Tcan_15487 [Toxocara canis]|uniref:Uncharacterized protein n=1 Tax=Toxocara canis TaxID=6265 RepID=A0A0B2V075_TOXCA|nr:hypothetical protein Tcan_15487 [Toxocara canis]
MHIDAEADESSKDVITARSPTYTEIMTVLPSCDVVTARPPLDIGVVAKATSRDAITARSPPDDDSVSSENDVITAKLYAAEVVSCSAEDDIAKAKQPRTMLLSAHAAASSRSKQFCDPRHSEAIIQVKAIEKLDQLLAFAKSAKKRQIEQEHAPNVNVGKEMKAGIGGIRWTTRSWVIGAGDFPELVMG